MSTVDGTFVHFGDVKPGASGEYAERWGRSIGPQLRTQPGVVDVLRYVATPRLHEMRNPASASEFTDGRSSLMTMVLLSGEDIGEAGAQARSTVESGTSMTTSAGLFRLAWALGEDGLSLQPGALPFVGHAGVQVALGDVPDPSARPVIAEWYRSIHAPDVLSVPGVPVALGFVSQDTEPVPRHLVMFFLEVDPAVAKERIQLRVPEWRAAGRSPSPGGASRSIFHGPFTGLGPGFDLESALGEGVS